MAIITWLGKKPLYKPSDFMSWEINKAWEERKKYIYVYVGVKSMNQDC
mgnify:CR=1 FL=1